MYKTKVNAKKTRRCENPSLSSLKKSIFLIAVFLVFFSTLNLVMAQIVVKMPAPVEMNLDLKNIGTDDLFDWQMEVVFWEVNANGNEIPNTKVQTTMSRGGGTCNPRAYKEDCGCTAWVSSIGAGGSKVITCWVPSEHWGPTTEGKKIKFHTTIWYLPQPWWAMYDKESSVTITIEEADLCNPDNPTDCPDGEKIPYRCSDNRCYVLYRKALYSCDTSVTPNRCKFDGYQELSPEPVKPAGMVCNPFNPGPMSPEVGYGCGVDLSSCQAGQCTADIYYRVCDGNGNCKNDNVDAAKETIHAAEGYTLVPLINDQQPFLSKCGQFGKKECGFSDEIGCWQGEICRYGKPKLKCGADNQCSFIDQNDLSGPLNVDEGKKCENGEILDGPCKIADWKCSSDYKSKIRILFDCYGGSCSKQYSESINCGSDDSATDSDDDNPSVLSVCYGGIERGCDDAGGVETGRCYEVHTKCYNGCPDVCYRDSMREYYLADLNPTHPETHDSVKESCDFKDYPYDTTQGACEVCIGSGHYRSDIGYEGGNKNCCGDDVDEYLITTNGKIACCDKPTDCVDSSGSCQVGVENWLAGNCYDGIDNDCDGVTDNDPECVQNYYLIPDGKWCPKDSLCNSGKCDHGDSWLCFDCADCSGVDRCSNQESNECEAHCGASAMCNDANVDACLNLDDDDSFLNLADEYCGDCLYDGCNDNCCKLACENVGDCTSGSNSCSGSHCLGYSCQCCLNSGSNCGSGGCSPGCCDFIKQSTEGNSYGCCKENQCWDGSNCQESGYPSLTGEFICDRGQWRKCSESTACDEYADHYCAWTGGETYQWLVGSSNNQECDVCKKCSGTSAYNEETAPECSKLISTEMTKGCDGEKYCCGGRCVDPPGTNGYAQNCENMDDSCSGIWTCDGTDYACSSKGKPCAYRDSSVEDVGYTSNCDKDGKCQGGTPVFGGSCKICKDLGSTLDWDIFSYDNKEDANGLATCSGACKYCFGGVCKDMSCNIDDKEGIKCDENNVCDLSGSCVGKRLGGEQCRVSGCSYDKIFCQSGVCCSDNTCKAAKNGCCINSECSAGQVCNEYKQCVNADRRTECWDGTINDYRGSGYVDGPWLCNSGTWRLCDDSTLCDEYENKYCGQGYTWIDGKSEDATSCKACMKCSGTGIPNEGTSPAPISVDQGQKTTGCSASGMFCCNGNCVIPGGDFGGTCGTGNCVGQWQCDGTNYVCGSKGNDCTYCEGDTGYKSTCDKDGKCTDGTATVCPACTKCNADSTTAIKCDLLSNGAKDNLGDSTCLGSNSFCCGGNCVTTLGGDYGQSCGSGSCASTWKCDGTDYDCSLGVDCSYCDEDIKYDSKCTREGTCPSGTSTQCPACKTCGKVGSSIECINSYELGEDLTEPNICSGACKYCTGGVCKDMSCNEDSYGITCFEQMVCDKTGTCINKALPGDPCGVDACTGTIGDSVLCLNPTNPTTHGTCCAPDSERGKTVNTCKGDCCTNADCTTDEVCNAMNWCQKAGCTGACEELGYIPTKGQCRPINTPNSCNNDEVDVSDFVTNPCPVAKPKCCCVMPCNITSPAWWCAFDSCGYSSESECNYQYGTYKPVYDNLLDRPPADFYKPFEKEIFKVWCAALTRNVRVVMTPTTGADYNLFVTWDSSTGAWDEGHIDCAPHSGTGVAETCDSTTSGFPLGISAGKPTLIAVTEGTGKANGGKYSLSVICSKPT